MDTEGYSDIDALNDALGDPESRAQFRLHGALSSGHRLRGNPEDLHSAIATSRLLVYGGLGPIYHRGQILPPHHPDRFRHIEVLDPEVATPFIAAAYQIVGVPGCGREDFFLSPVVMAGLDPGNPVIHSGEVFIR